MRTISTKGIHERSMNDHDVKLFKKSMHYSLAGRHKAFSSLLRS
ncbi:MAG: hypothetical protein ACTSVI_13815 [Promethearchaeota archaeon]